MRGGHHELAGLTTVIVMSSEVIEAGLVIVR